MGIFKIDNLTKMILALFVGFLGAILFIILHLPLPWLLGAIFATSIAVRFDNIKIQTPKPFSSPARVLIGLTIGTAFTPEILSIASSYIYSLLFVIPFTLVTLFAGAYYFMKYQGFDKKTAFLSAMPGGVIEMVIIAEEIKADISKITLVQSSRLFFIVISLPLIIQYVLQVDISGNKLITTSITNINFFELFLLIILGFLGAFVAKKIKLSAAYLMGPMILSVALHGSGIMTTIIPDEFLKFVQIVFGTIIGFTFKGVTLKEISKSIICYIRPFFYYCFNLYFVYLHSLF